MSQESGATAPTVDSTTTATTEAAAPAAEGAVGFQSLLTRESAVQTTPATEVPKEAEQPKVDDPAMAVPATPQDYALNFGEGVQVDKALLTGFQAKAHEMGLQQGQAQKLAGLYEQHARAAQERQMAAYQQAIRGWEQEITSSKTYATDVEHAKRAMAKFGSEQLNGKNGLLNETFLGSHPEMFKFMAKVGAALGEPGFRANGEGARPRKSAAEILYPPTNH